MTTQTLLTRLELNQPIIAQRNATFRGVRPIRFTTAKMKPVANFSANLGRLAVTAVAERIHIDDVSATVDGIDYTEEARKLIRDCDLPMMLQSIVVDALAVGSAYLMVWVDQYGRPVVTGESAEYVAVERDPITGGVVEAIKRWHVTTPEGVVTEEHVVKYLPNRIVHLKRDKDSSNLKFVSQVDNPLGVVPVVPLVNVERIGDQVGASVLDDLAPLLDALNKLFVDMLVTSEAVARPKRYATGVDLEEGPGALSEPEGFMVDADPVEVVEDILDEIASEPVSPFKDSDDMWITEQAEAKFGQLPGADMNGYRTGVDLVVQQIMAVTSLPAHFMGITTANPATAEALRASEVALASNAASRIRVFNRPVEWAVRLLVAIEAGVTPDRVEANVKWADPTTRSVAQEADAATKLHSEGITTTDEARELVGANEEL